MNNKEEKDKPGWEPLEPGMYILDKEFHGGYPVEVTKKSGRLFAVVRGEGSDETWQVMINRLTKVKK